jgi:hypothetical protein
LAIEVAIDTVVFHAARFSIPQRAVGANRIRVIIHVALSALNAVISTSKAELDVFGLNSY